MIILRVSRGGKVVVLVGGGGVRWIALIVSSSQLQLQSPLQLQVLSDADVSVCPLTD